MLVISRKRPPNRAEIASLGNWQQSSTASIHTRRADGVPPPFQGSWFILYGEENDQRAYGNPRCERRGEDIIVLFPPRQAMSRKPIHEDEAEYHARRLVRHVAWRPVLYALLK